VNIGTGYTTQSTGSGPRRRLGLVSSCQDTGWAVALAALLCLGLGALPGRVEANEVQRAENTVPESPEDLPDQLSRAFEEAPEEEPVPTRARDAKFPFLTGSRLVFRSRSYDFRRDLRDVTESGALDTENRAAATGGELAFSTGKWRDLLSGELGVYTSQKIWGPRDKGGTSLLTPEQNSITVLGRARVELKRGNTVLRLYRQALNLPYVNTSDSRMIPNTHEAYLLGRQGTGRDFVIGHVRQMKTRDTDDFRTMGEVAGVSGSDDGLTMAGFRIGSRETLQFGVITQQTWNLFNTTYAEINRLRLFNDDLSLDWGAQYTHQRSVGDELLGDLDSYAWGGRGTLGYRGRYLNLSYTQIQDNAQIRNPFGGTALYNSMMLSDFDAAGERSLRLGTAINMARFGLPSWGGYLSVAHGWNRGLETSDASLPDQTGYDLTIDYRPTSGVLKGLWARLRFAYIDFEDSNGHRKNLRLILNYELPEF